MRNSAKKKKKKNQFRILIIGGKLDFLRKLIYEYNRMQTETKLRHSRVGRGRDQSALILAK